MTCIARQMKSSTKDDANFLKQSQLWNQVLHEQRATLRGCAIAQAVSCWLSTAAARVWARVWSCGICGGQSGAGAGFLQVLRFPLPILIPPIAPQWPSSIIWGLYNRPEVATVPSGLSPTTVIIIIIIKNIYIKIKKRGNSKICAVGLWINTLCEVASRCKMYLRSLNIVS
jgi:hypothetical protein